MVMDDFLVERHPVSGGCKGHFREENKIGSGVLVRVWMLENEMAILDMPKKDQRL